MRTKRENTYGMPARILANANRGRIVQDANDCNGFQTAAMAADPRPRWPRPLVERDVRVRSQVAAHAQR